jgi:hypothetical protein
VSAARSVCFCFEQNFFPPDRFLGEKNKKIPAGVPADPRKQAAEVFYPAEQARLFVASVRLCSLKNALALPREKVDAILAKPELIGVFAADDEPGMAHALEHGKVSQIFSDVSEFFPPAPQADLSDLTILQQYGTVHAPIGIMIEFGGSSWKTKLLAVKLRVITNMLALRFFLRRRHTAPQFAKGVRSEHSLHKHMDIEFETAKRRDVAVTWLVRRNAKK